MQFSYFGFQKNNREKFLYFLLKILLNINPITDPIKKPKTTKYITKRIKLIGWYNNAKQPSPVQLYIFIIINKIGKPKKANGINKKFKEKILNLIIIINKIK